MRVIDATAFSALARKATQSVSDLAGLFHNLVMDVRDSYRPERHYMRGPGPKWRAKHQPWQALALAKLDSEAKGQSRRQELSPVDVPNRVAAPGTR